MLNFFLFIFAWLLIPPLTVWNLIVVNKKYGNTKGYFRSTALSIDIWANREFRAFWNEAMRKENGYQFGVVDETISSALGKNQTMPITGEEYARIKRAERERAEIRQRQLRRSKHRRNAREEKNLMNQGIIMQSSYVPLHIPITLPPHAANAISGIRKRLRARDKVLQAVIDALNSRYDQYGLPKSRERIKIDETKAFDLSLTRLTDDEIAQVKFQPLRPPPRKPLLDERIVSALRSVTAQPLDFDEDSADFFTWNPAQKDHKGNIYTPFRLPIANLS